MSFTGSCVVDMDVTNPVVKAYLDAIIKEWGWILNPEIGTWTNYGVSVEGIKIGIPIEEAEQVFGQRFSPKEKMKYKDKDGKEVTKTVTVVSIGKRTNPEPNSYDIEAVLKEYAAKGEKISSEEAKNQARERNTQVQVNVDAHPSQDQRRRVNEKGEVVKSKDGREEVFSPADFLKDRIKRAGLAATGLAKAVKAAKVGSQFGKSGNLGGAAVIKEIANGIKNHAHGFKGKCRYGFGAAPSAPPSPPRGQSGQSDQDLENLEEKVKA